MQQELSAVYTMILNKNNAAQLVKRLANNLSRSDRRTQKMGGGDGLDKGQLTHAGSTIKTKTPQSFQDASLVIKTCSYN